MWKDRLTENTFLIIDVGINPNKGGFDNPERQLDFNHLLTTIGKQGLA
jgi:hypothetical protein